MTAEEKGVYIGLLSALWINGNRLPEDMRRIARASCCDLDEVERSWPAVKQKLVIEEGLVMHERLEKIMEKMEINRQNGKKGGRPKKPTGKGKRNPTNNPNGTQSKTQKKPSALKNEERRMKNEVVEEDWVFPAGWDSPELRSALDDWCEMRVRIKKPVNSRKSTSKVFKRFDSPEHLIAAAELCEANGWQGLKPEYGRVSQKAGTSVHVPKTFHQQSTENGIAAGRRFLQRGNDSNLIEDKTNG